MPTVRVKRWQRSTDASVRVRMLRGEGSAVDVEAARSRRQLTRYPTHLVGPSPKASCGGRIGFLHDAEQGAAGILQHDVIRSRRISPGMPSRPQGDETLDLRLLIFRIEVEMSPAAAAWTRVATLE